MKRDTNSFATFGDRLSFAMRKEKINQSELSRLLKCTQPTIHGYLENKVFPRPYHAQALAYYTKVRFKWLFYNRGRWSYEGNYPMIEFWNSIGDRICFLIWTRERNILETSKGIKMSYAAVEMWIEGKRNPSPSSVDRLISFFSVPYDWLCHGLGEPGWGDLLASPYKDKDQ